MTQNDVLLLHRIEHCDPVSRQRFFDFYRLLSTRFELSLRVVMTTSDLPSLEIEDDGWLTVDVEQFLEPADDVWDATADSLHHVYPFEEEKERIREALGRVSLVGQKDRHIVLSLIQRCASWPSDISLDSFREFIALCALISEEDSASAVLDKILRLKADAALAQWLLVWLRNPSRNRLRLPDLFFLFHQSVESNLASACLPSKPFLKKDLDALLHILLKPRQEEIELHQDVLDILDRAGDGEQPWLWHGIEEKAGQIIVDTALLVLAFPVSTSAFTAAAEAYYSASEFPAESIEDVATAPMRVDGSHVAFKLLWALCYHQLPNPAASKEVRDKFASQVLETTPENHILWMRIYWAMSSPFVRGAAPELRPDMRLLDFVAIMSGDLQDNLPTRKARYLAASYIPQIRTPSVNPGSRPPSPAAESLAEAPLEPSSTEPNPDDSKPGDPVTKSTDDLSVEDPEPTVDNSLPVTTDRTSAEVSESITNTSLPQATELPERTSSPEPPSSMEQKGPQEPKVSPEPADLPEPTSSSPSADPPTSPIIQLSPAQEALSKLQWSLFRSLKSCDYEAALSIASDVRTAAQVSELALTWPAKIIWSAAWHNAPRLLEHFLQDGADPNLSDLVLVDNSDADSHLSIVSDNWVCPLYVAATFGHIEVVRVLLQHGARKDLHMNNDWKPTALDMAVTHSNREVLRELLDHNDKELEEHGRLLALLYMAADSGNVGVLPEMLERLRVKKTGESKDVDSSVPDAAEPDSNPLNQFAENHTLTPLMGACSYGWPAATAMLLEHGADPHLPAKESDSDTPLWRAMQYRPCLDIVRLLLQHGIDPNEDYNGAPTCHNWLTTVLGEATQPHDLFLVEMMTAFLNGPKPLLVNAQGARFGSTLLMTAAHAGSMVLIRWLLDNGANVSLCDHRGRTALWYAILNKQVDTVRELLDRHAEHRFDVVDSESNGTILSLACDSVEITEMLLDAKVDVNMRNGDGPTAIDTAICIGNDKVVEMLIDRGADLSIVDMNNWSPLATAISYSRTEQVRMLVDAGASPDDIISTLGPQNENLVHLSSSKAEILRIILGFGKRIDVDHADIDGDTPLMMAAGNASEQGLPGDCLRLLLRAGADVNLQNKAGETALHKAVDYGLEERVRLLLAAPGVKMDVVDEDCWTPLILACALNNPDVVQALIDHGASVDQTFSGYSIQYSPLIAATLIIHGNARRHSAFLDDINKIVRILVAAGADVKLNMPERLWSSPLASAALGAGVDTIEFLMDKCPSSIQQPSHFGRRPIHYAAANGIENLEALYERDKEGLMLPDNGGKHTIHWAAQFGNAKAVEFILSKYDEGQAREDIVKKPDNDGWTPLFWALRPLKGGYVPEMRSEERNYAGVIRALLENGLEITPDLKCVIGQGDHTASELGVLDAATLYGSDADVIELIKERLYPKDPEQNPEDEQAASTAEEQPEASLVIAAEIKTEAVEGDTEAPATEAPPEKYMVHDGEVCKICLMVRSTTRWYPDEKRSDVLPGHCRQGL